MSLELKYFSGVDDFYNLRHDWMSFVQSLKYNKFFYEWEWYKVYIENLLADKLNINFLIVYKEKKIVGILPYEIIQENKLSINLTFLKVPVHPHVALCDIIINSEEDLVVESMIDFLDSKMDINWHVLNIPKMLESSPVVQQLQHYNKLSIYRKLTTTSAYFNCLSEEPHYEANLSSKFRRNMRRLLGRAEKKGFVSFHYINEFPDLEIAYQEFIQVESAGWKGEEGTSTAISLDRNLTGFYFDLAKLFSDRNKCQINLMKIDNKCIAAQFCLIQHGVLYILKIGYDESFKDIAPGSLLLYDLMKKCTEDSSICKLSLVTGPSWAKRWHPFEEKVYDIVVVNNNIKGNIYNSALKLKNYDAIS